MKVKKPANVITTVVSHPSKSVILPVASINFEDFVSHLHLIGALLLIGARGYKRSHAPHTPSQLLKPSVQQ